MARYSWPRDEDRVFWQDWSDGVSASHVEQAHRGRAAAAPFALPGDRKNYLRDRDFDVNHVKIEVTLDVSAKQVHGKTTLKLEALSGTSKLVELDSEDTVVGAVTVDGRRASFTSGEKTLVIDLPKAPPIGAKLSVAIEYVSTPQRGIYFTGPDDGYPDKPHQVWTQGQDTDNHHWFPCIDEPKGRLTSEVIATVPATWTVVSNGRLASVKDSGTSQAGKGTKQKTFHWVQDKPHAVYLITLAAGEMSHVVLQEKPVLVDFYCAPGREADGKRSFGNTPAMIKLYEDLFGEKYPWAKYTQVAAQDFIFGGMENTSATTQTDLTLHDAKAHLDFSSDFLVAHEAVHQWFGDLLTCREWPHGWLNEGFATFFESVWQEHHHGIDEYLYDVMGLARGYMSERYRRPIVERTYNVPVDIFDRHLYDKAGVVLHMLRRELGDGPFYRAIKHYVQQHKGRNVATGDLKRAIEEATGRNMDWFFDQRVYSPGHPDLKATYSWDDKTKTATIGVKQSQTGDGIPEVFRASVDIAFVVGDGATRHVERVKLNAREHTFLFALPAKPKMVQFDPGYSLLKSLDFTKPKDMLIFQLEHDTDIAGRIEAARGLGKNSSPDSIKVLKKAVLDDEFWGVQVNAARALGEIRTSDALDALVACVKTSHPKARRGVAEALGNFRNSEKAAAALTKLLESDVSYYVTSTAAASLGKTRVASGFSSLEKALARDSHLETIRTGAINGLAEYKGDLQKKARKVVAGWTEYGRPARARESAIAALGRLGKDDVETLDRLVDLLDDRWYRARYFAIHALEELKEPDAIGAIQRMAAKENDGRVIRVAREAVTAIRAGNKDDTAKLRDDFGKLEEENRKLRERLDKVEQRLSPKSPPTEKKTGRKSVARGKQRGRA